MEEDKPTCVLKVNYHEQQESKIKLLATSWAILKVYYLPRNVSHCIFELIYDALLQLFWYTRFYLKGYPVIYGH